MAASNESKRVPLKFRCSDEAYERLKSAHVPVGDGGRARPGQRLDHVLAFYCDVIEKTGEVPLIPRPPDPPGRVRHLMVDATVKARFDALTKNVQASTEQLVREAIYRFLGAC